MTDKEGRRATIIVSAITADFDAHADVARRQCGFRIDVAAALLHLDGSGPFAIALLNVIAIERNGLSIASRSVETEVIEILALGS